MIAFRDFCNLCQIVKQDPDNEEYENIGEDLGKMFYDDDKDIGNFSYSFWDFIYETEVSDYDCFEYYWPLLKEFGTMKDFDREKANEPIIAAQCKAEMEAFGF